MSRQALEEKAETIRKRKAAAPAPTFYAIDSGFRIRQETTGLELALVYCQQDGGLNGWLETAGKSKSLPKTVECRDRPEHGVHELVTLTAAIWSGIVDLSECGIGIGFGTLVATLLTAPEARS